MTKTILVVDDMPDNIRLLKDVLTDKGFQVRAATNGEKALKLARTEPKPDLILLDVMMPEMDGYEVCQRLKAEPSTAHIPVIFVTANGETEDETRGFECGAVDYIIKPISPPIVLARVQTHLSLVRTESLDALAHSAIRMLGEAGHYNDTDTGEHIWRMAAYSRALAKAAGWDDEHAEMIELAAPMHDTGKIGIPDAILKAPRKLDPQEWAEMQSHCRIGHDILSMSDNPVFKLAAEIALGHHEKWDGSGYPLGLVGEAIPESSRIVAIADVFDALTMKRPYKEAWTVEAAIEEIQGCAGSHFEPRLVDHFLSIEGEIREIKIAWDR
jgi:putative two-component system response regulator